MSLSQQVASLMRAEGYGYKVVVPKRDKGTRRVGVLLSKDGKKWHPIAVDKNTSTISVDSNDILFGDEDVVKRTFKRGFTGIKEDVEN